ncbi:MAG TPA: NAD(P)/FAD-dependent oxidoreductase [Steroidobacteraceae bacterium]|jgi:thioredoxin reductase|nr:NAD(P)/FAD-dependent oxidoreductase [Steroidobacteraceae bacterium]
MKSRAHTSLGHDRASVAGKQPPIDESTDVLIVGAGPAGVAAALTTARGGVRVTLVDENPVPLQTMGEDVPLHFGGRMAPSVANRNSVLESVLRERPQLAEAMDAGVDVRLGTAAWGLFPRRRTAGWIDGHVAGLADEDHAYLLRFRQVIIAAGCRDMGVAFDGWQRPGVMGASAAYRLAMTYEALDCRTAVLVGSNTEALQIANALMDAGVRIAAIVEQAAAITGPGELWSRLQETGTRLFTRRVIQQTVGDPQGVAAVRLAGVGSDGARLSDPLERIECDTVLLAVAAIPAIELIESTGCTVSFQAERGGHVAVIDGSQRTSLPFMYVAGDCAGVWPSKTRSGETAAREGRIAARAALSALGAEPPGSTAPQDSRDEPVVPDPPGRDIALERLAWVRAMTTGCAAAPFVCQCEEVTAADILELHPPRYLQWQRDPVASWRVGSVDPQGAPDPDVVKRLTRAGMGPCQGRRCREQIAALMALGTGSALADIPLATYRPPVRPLRLALLAALPETAAMAEGWDSWFGMPSQWIPFWRLSPACSAAEGCAAEPAGGE